MDYKKFFSDSLNSLKKSGEYRVFKDIGRIAGSFPNAKFNDLIKKENIVVWCSNDYLGMGQHPFVLEAIERAMRELGAGSGGTRNISGTNHYHIALENEISEIHEKESSLVFTSGYVANDATLSTLGSKLKSCAIFSDEKNHASMINGIRNSKSEKFIFKHNDIKHLETLLKKIASQTKVICFVCVMSIDSPLAKNRLFGIYFAVSFKLVLTSEMIQDIFYKN